MDGYCLLNPTSRFLLIFAISLMTVSLFVFEFTSRRRMALYILMAAALFAGYLFASLDPFLHMWDEQFHVLVAKNLIENPIKPMLFKDFIHNYSFKSWDLNEIWLHKQPLFMWQMALSMSVFGVNEIAARLPDVLMHALMVVLIYRIGNHAVNFRVGFYAALIYAFAHFPLELISGSYVNDHNDKAFIFYITASFWALFEFRNSNKKRFMYLIGILAGCAVMVKWLAGFLVFGPWFLVIVLYSSERFKIKTYLPVIKAFAICLLVVLPWQIYTMIRFPDEARFELFHAASHFTEAVEGHSGDLLFHFEAIKILIADYAFIYLIVIAGLITMYFIVKSKENYVLIMSAIVAVYAIFTAACTKMESFTAIVSPLIFIAVLSMVEYLISFIYRNKKSIIRNIVTFAVILFIALLTMNLPKSFDNHIVKNDNPASYRSIRIREAIFYKKINEFLQGGKYVVYNAGFNMHSEILAMFYTDYICHAFCPTIEQINESINKGYKVAVLDYKGIPDNISGNPEVKVIKIPFYESFGKK